MPSLVRLIEYIPPYLSERSDAETFPGTTSCMAACRILKGADIEGFSKRYRLTCD